MGDKLICFLLPASCFLLPASCFLLPASCFLLPASCFLLPASCFLLPASCFLLPASCFLLPASCFLLPASCFLCRYCTRLTFYYSRKREKREENSTQSSLFSGRFGSQREYTYKESRVALEGGFALVTVLMLASLLLVMLVGLFFLTGEEEKRSSLYIEGERATMLVETALAEVKAKLMDGGEIPYREGVARASMTACPGLLEVRRYDVLPNRGYQVGREAFTDPNSFFRKPFAREYERGGQGDWQPANPQWIALYSQKWYAPLCAYMTVNEGEVRDKNPDYDPKKVFNLNTKDNPFTPGRLYLGGMGGETVGVKNISLKGEYPERGEEGWYQYRSGESSVERPLYVQWIPIYKNPRYGEVLPSREKNAVVGRYAYWVDVENTKINVNSVKREWEQTALGALTGVSDAESKRKGSYFDQWGEGEKETPRYVMEYNKPSSYKLFRDKLPTDYGVKLYYRQNYGALKKRGNYAIEEYERVVFDWEENGQPPAIADHGTIDWRTFNALRPASAWKKTEWLEGLLKRGSSKRGYNTVGELYRILDPEVERKRLQKYSEAGLRGYRKMYGQGLTIYGWEEERDPLGRPKLDINVILKEGDALFDKGRGLPDPDHRGTLLQQLLARLHDKKYHSAYYSKAYPSGGKELSFVDGLKAFAGRGADADQYGEAMLAQLVTNIIGYGRDHEDPPFISKQRGIVEAKSMPYVAEVAIRARNAIWDYWDNPFFSQFDFHQLRIPDEELDDFFVPDINTSSRFPGVEESEVYYEERFDREYRELIRKKNMAVAYKIAQFLIRGRDFDLPDILLKERVFTGGYANREHKVEIFGETYPHLDLGAFYVLKEIVSRVIIDVAFVVVNPNPLARDKISKWEMEMDYSWYDPEKGRRPRIGVWGEDGDSYFEFFDEINRAFRGATGTRKHTLSASLEEQHHCPHLFPGDGVNAQGYFFENLYQPSQAHHLVYFRARPEQFINKDKRTFDNALIPGDFLDGFVENFRGPLQSVHQPFRLRGWRIYRKDSRYPGGRALYHEAPIRHPGQKAKPREFWQMTVDRDGRGPEPPPNCGVAASTMADSFGLSRRAFRYPDLHALEHFRDPLDSPIRNLSEGIGKNEVALPFGLGLGREINREWRELSRRKDVATSWFSSQTIVEFSKFAESLMLTIPSERLAETRLLQIATGSRNDPDSRIHQQALRLEEVILGRDGIPYPISAPENIQYFYHVEEELVKKGQQAFRGLEGKLYMPNRALDIYKEWEELSASSGTPEEKSRATMARQKMRSDLTRFFMLQLKLRDEAMHHNEVVRKTGRNQLSTGSLRDDSFVPGMALVERIVCIDPIVGHRTGNCDLLVKRYGKTYCGHFYGVNGHPWRRYHYYFYHYDKDNDSPQAEVLGRYRRPEPDRALTEYFSDPRRTDGRSEPRYSQDLATWSWKGKQYQLNRNTFIPRKIPAYGLTGSVLQNALLTKNQEHPHLLGEKGWSEVLDLEVDEVHVWPWGPGMGVGYGYHVDIGDEGIERKETGQERMAFRNGSFLTHAPRGKPMISVGEIGFCHSGFLQRAINLDRPPILPAEGVRRLGSPAFGPPMSMLLDLVVPSNVRDERGNYINKKKWEKGGYISYSPENPRVGTWNINNQIASDHYLATREGAHGELNLEGEDFWANTLEGIPLHPVLIPSALGKQIGREREVVDGRGALDPHLSPLVHFRRGWGHWLGAIAGDYSAHRNLGGGGVWNKKKENEDFRDESAYAIAQGLRNFSWYPGGVKKKGRTKPYVRFDREEKRANLLVLGREEREEGLGGHVSADGPVRWGNEKRKAVYPVEEGDDVSLYDVTRYGLFPLVHHLSEVGYTGLGKVYTALNHRSSTTPAHGGFQFEEKLVDKQVGGDGILGAMSQAGFARNAPWVMAANQISTSANVFTVHIVAQSLKDRQDVSQPNAVELKGREKKHRVKQEGLRTKNEIFGEQWMQVVVARVPKKNKRGKILKDLHGAPQYDYRILRKQVLENVK